MRVWNIIGFCNYLWILQRNFVIFRYFEQILRILMKF